jgi:hypothetical protein
MHQLTKSLHVLAVGLWFGMAVFFSFPVALSLFDTFERVTEPGQRPAWFPPSLLYSGDPANWTSPPAGIDKPIFKSARDVQKEQGSRAAGAAVSPMFSWYFGMQLGCAAVALLTALRLLSAEPKAKVHKARLIVLIFANLLMLAGLGLERKVSELRGPRNNATDALLIAAPNIPEDIYNEAADARKAFGMWHGISTTLNLGTIILVSIAMALAAQLPAGSRPQAAQQAGEDKL